MAVVLYHHPFTRAANVIWMLEEVGVPYELRFVDVRAGAHKAPDLLALNPMGKLPILTDGDAVVTESAAIGLYLADRYAAGRLAPALDDPRRAAYLRWVLFAPSVIEPGAMAKAAGWTYRESSAGFGNHDAMLATIEHAIGAGPYVLGDDFTMADVVFGGTLGFMLAFNLIDKLPEFEAYVAGLMDRPARQQADKVNAAELAKLPPPPSAS